MKDALDFAAINQVALAAFPADLNRLLAIAAGRRPRIAQPNSPWLTNG
jgi:hypothetical protein